MISADDLQGIDELTALRIIAVARSIAPCLDSLEYGADREQAVAILKGVAQEATGRGSRHIKGQRIGSAAVDYRSVSDWFSQEDKDALRAICKTSAGGGGPVGLFPAADRTLSRLFPESQS